MKRLLVAALLLGLALPAWAADEADEGNSTAQNEEEVAATEAVQD